MQRLKGMADSVGFDYTAFHHDGFAGSQPALPIFKIDDWQQPLMERQRFCAAAGFMMAEDRLDKIRDHGARHHPRCASIQVGQQGDALFAVERADDALTACCDQRAQLGRGARHFDLEILD